MQNVAQGSGLQLSLSPPPVCGLCGMISTYEYIRTLHTQIGRKKTTTAVWSWRTRLAWEKKGVEISPQKFHPFWPSSSISLYYYLSVSAKKKKKKRKVLFSFSSSSFFPPPTISRGADSLNMQIALLPMDACVCVCVCVFIAQTRATYVRSAYLPQQPPKLFF